MAGRDFLDEQIAQRTAENPEFPALVEAALRRRELLRALAALRKAQGESQRALAAAIGSSQSSLARIESAESDVRLSTVERIASRLGYQVEWRLIPNENSDAPAPAPH